MTIDAFPKNEAGKILYGALLERAKQHLILFSDKMLHFIGEATRKSALPFCAEVRKTRLMQTPTRLRRYKTLFKRFIGV